MAKSSTPAPDTPNKSDPSDDLQIHPWIHTDKSGFARKRTLRFTPNPPKLNLTKK